MDRGSLFVADDFNGRILVFNNVDSLSSNDPSADASVGQAAFTSGGSLHFPNAVSVANCTLYIAQPVGNDDVLVYNSVPTTGAANPPPDATLGTGTVGPVTANDLQPGALAAFAGGLYVADQGQNRVLRFDCATASTPTFTFTPTPTFTFTPVPTCCFSTTANWGPTGTGYSFGSLWGVALDGSASCNGQAGPCVYVTDIATNSVYKFDSAGTLVTSWTGSPSSGPLAGPHGIAVNSAGTSIFVADTGNSRVVVFDPSGAYLNQWGTNGPGAGQFASDFEVAVDPVNGNIYTTDQINGGRVQEFQAGTFTPLAQWNTGGTSWGDFVGPDETVYVVVQGVGVKKYTASGTLTGLCAANTSQGGNVWADGTGHLWVAVLTNTGGGIQEFDSNCNPLCLLETQGQFPVLGMGIPFGVALDSAGKIYVASGNQMAEFVPVACPAAAIRKAPSGAVAATPTPTPSAP